MSSFLKNAVFSGLLFLLSVDFDVVLSTCLKNMSVIFLVVVFISLFFCCFLVFFFGLSCFVGGFNSNFVTIWTPLGFCLGGGGVREMGGFGEVTAPPLCVTSPR